MILIVTVFLLFNYSSQKSKGFNLEDTHMTAPAKIDRLMSVLALCCPAARGKPKINGD